LPELRIDFDSAQSDSVVTLNLKDTYRVSFGATYKVSSSWTLRGGLALDQSPVTTPANRTPRLPDADRTWYALGAGFQPNPTLSFDFGYVYIKVSDSNVTKTAAPGNENFSRGNLNVNYSGSVQVLSAQARWAF
jgi:long-chain fatty acid transport protein